MSSPAPTTGDFPVRADLHCHSTASTEADEALLLAIKCPESYSRPAEVYAQAKRRGMTFACLTDHDTLDGALSLVHHPDVIVGEELTCYFPEDRCKMHVLVWGIDRREHAALQQLADDIYEVAAYVERNRVAHSVAHPVYRQNDRLERWHLERLMLMFKGFECLNGAHSNLHRESFEPMLDELTPDRMTALARRHELRARWPDPHVKARTGGSDDHGLFNIGRTWTEFPADATTVDAVLECLRTARCRPGGEAGSSVKLAHNFYSVGIKYYSRSVLSPTDRPTLPTTVLQMLVGERPPLRRREVARLAAKRVARRVGAGLARPFRRPRPKTGTALLLDLFLDSARGRLREHDAVARALRGGGGDAPLGEHAAMFDFVSALNRDVSGGIVASVERAVGRGEVTTIFDALSAVAAHQFILLPYYFALFHQNRERHLLSRLTGHGRRVGRDTLRVGVFTDTFDEVNGVARFVKAMADTARVDGRGLQVATCVARVPAGAAATPYRVNFQPLVSRPLPLYPELTLTVPPVAEVLRWADEQQFDAVHIDTPGAMGLCGWLVSRMLRVPLVATHHTDLPRYVHDLTRGDHRLTHATEGYLRWLYGQATTVFTRTRAYAAGLRTLGVGGDRLAVSPPAIDTDTFSPRHRDPGLWERLKVREPHRLLYVGRVSVEKNLPLLVEAFRGMCAGRRDVALVVAGDGPYRAEMARALRGLPAYFLGYQDDSQLAPLYASSDLFVFPSRTDTLGQVVIEAQASGLPVLVSTDGGPREVTDDGITGLILPATDPAAWARAIAALLDDEPRRQRMSRTAPGRMARFSVGNAFATWWDAIADAAVRAQNLGEAKPAVPAAPVAPAQAGQNAGPFVTSSLG